MRAVAGSGHAGTLPGEFDRHLDMLSRCIARAPSPEITLVLRTPSSAPAKALIAMKDDLVRAGASARAVIAKLEPEADLRALLATLSALAPHDPVSTLVRLARNPRLHDAHEQAAYGGDSCWFGDALRRDAARRNALNLFHEQAADMTRFARLAFAALWESSSPVPPRYFRGDPLKRPLGEYQRAPAAPAAVSPRRPSHQGWPLIRH